MKQDKCSFYLLTAEEMRQADERTSTVIGIPSLVLMERAALSMAEEIEKRFSLSSRVVIVSGKGNNGADGLALGRILLEKGYDVRIIVLSLKGKPGSAFETQMKILKNLDAEVSEYKKGSITSAGGSVIVDALFGTGLDRRVNGTAGEALAEISAAGENGAFVLACDIPSGISSDTGKILGTYAPADLTVTFGFYKRGQFLYPGCIECKETIRKDIGITEDSFQDTPRMFAYKKAEYKNLLPYRQPAGNKGTFGKVLLAAGSKNMAGACLLAARSAGRAGAGMVKIYTEECNRTIVQESVPECLLGTYEEDKEDFPGLKSSLLWADVIAAGPGLGKTEKKIALIKNILLFAGDKEHQGKRYVFDADAIRIIAENDLYELLSMAAANSDILLTPHLAEAAALLKTSVWELKEDIPGKAGDFAEKLHVTLLVKDARSILCTWKNTDVYLNVSGNSGLSTAGSGDVLTGICAALLAQGQPAEEAGSVGAFIHGLAAEYLTKGKDTRTIVASDLPDALAELIRG